MSDLSPISFLCVLFYHGYLMISLFLKLSLLVTFSHVRYNHYNTPTITKWKSYVSNVALAHDLTLYCSLIRVVKYLTFTRPYIPYVVYQVGIYMHDHWETHINVLKCKLCYLQSILSHVYQLYLSSMDHLVTYIDLN